jgi:hypothetical protein
MFEEAADISPKEITANVGTEGGVKKFLFWEISEEFPITR